MTANRPNDDLVVLGAPPHSPTRSPRVVHLDRDSSLRVRHAPVDAVPIHETTSTPAPDRRVAIPAAVGPAPSSVTANNRAATSPGARLNPTATAVLSVVVAVVFTAAAVALIAGVGLVAATDEPVITTALGAASLCGLVLTTAALTNVGGRR